MLDLAFVLLIIFMITTPLMENSVDLKLPSSDAAKDAVDPQMVQTITINNAAQIALNGEPLELAEHVLLFGGGNAKAGVPNLDRNETAPAPAAVLRLRD